jgi:hypothetical protein
MLALLALKVLLVQQVRHQQGKLVQQAILVQQVLKVLLVLLVQQVRQQLEI